MNKNIKLAVAGAVLALSASASAGIIIPAGEWTMDINGNVNAFANWTKAKGPESSGNNVITGGEVPARQAHEDNIIGINTGLLPAWLGFTGTTRQNDLDVSFTISMQPNVSDNFSHGDAKTPLNRQAFVTFGDKSWGSVKLGKDIGIFASDAILNDMTLLGVGAGAATSGNPTTLGGIGFGYIYAGWKGQVSYTTPNFNGFQATVGITNPNQASGATLAAASAVYQERFGLEGKASYAFGADNFSGKLWVSGATYEIQQTTTVANSATAADIGATINAGNVGLTGYYYRGDGAGTTVFGGNGATTTGVKRNSDGGYLQATYKLPTNTKLGIAYGQSSLDRAGGDENTLVKENTRITVGLYHPLTKHLNLVAEYNDTSSKNHFNVERTANTGSLGAILFF